MFLFNSNHGNDPISFPDHPFFHFPSPFDDDALLLQQPQHDILLHHQPLNETPATFVNALESASTRIVNAAADHVHDNLIMEQQIQRKRGSSKRDRHSKINTLRGPRDRRMRLSLPVAREFFGLQDMLGVDKASKTVEWLLFQARHAIKKLSREQSCHNGGGDADQRSPSSISDGEVVSGIDETVVINNSNKKEGRKATTKEKRVRGRVARKTTFHPLARERRDKARARARARTRAKQLQIRQKLLSEANPIDQIEATKQDLNKISSSWSTQMETGEESAGTQIDDQQFSSQYPRADQQLRTTDQRIIDDPDDCLMIMGRWSPSNSIYNSLHNNNGSPQEHPFGDFQFYGKPWEAYNNHGIC